MTIRATIDVVESLGSEKFVYFSKELGNVETAELAELARDSGRADTGDNTETLVARLDPDSQIREGQDAELWLDVEALHIFDPATGRNLTRGDGRSTSQGTASSTGGAAIPTQAAREASEQGQSSKTAGSH